MYPVGHPFLNKNGCVQRIRKTIPKQPAQFFILDLLFKSSNGLFNGRTFEVPFRYRLPYCWKRRKEVAVEATPEFANIKFLFSAYPAPKRPTLFIKFLLFML